MTEGADMGRGGWIEDRIRRVGQAVLLTLLFGLAACAHGGAALRLETIQRPAEPSVAAEEPFTLVQWNLGYGGLGFDADFKADGGKSLLPPSGKAVDRNLAGIQARLRAMPADLYVFQEMARPGLLTYGRDVAGAVAVALPTSTLLFSRDINQPVPRLHHGLGVASRVATQSVDLVAMPEDPKKFAGFITRHYHVQRIRLQIAGADWTVFNLHLSAFDGGEVRQAQLAALLTLVQAEAASGRHVVALGDWNLRLTPTHYAYTADASAQFWIRDFPVDQLPAGWRLVFDPTTPTVRTNEQPYVAGRNYTTIIDGALVSPGVDVVSVRTADTGFVATDHQPVAYVLKARPLTSSD